MARNAVASIGHLHSNGAAETTDAGKTQVPTFSEASQLLDRLKTPSSARPRESADPEPRSAASQAPPPPPPPGKAGPRRPQRRPVISRHKRVYARLRRAMRGNERSVAGRSILPRHHHSPPPAAARVSPSSVTTARSSERSSA